MALFTAASPVQRALRYRKFAGQTATVVVFDSGYHLQAECMAALARLGHKVVRIAVAGTGVCDGRDAMQALVRALVGHKPDMVLSINHIGFDTDGGMGGLLDAAEVPLAVWYVDSPFLIHDGYFLAAPKMTSVFVWERAYISVLQRCGAQSVVYLPLACDMTRFCAPREGPNPQAGTAVGFVGSSWQYNAQKWRKTLSAQSIRDAAPMTRALEKTPSAFMELLGTPRPNPDGRMSQLAYATFMATGTRRNQLLQRFAPDELTVVGDDGWHAILPQARTRPQVIYGPDLAQVYREFAVNLNITSLQMPTACNQRVFDVPAAGGFVLSDHQADLDELFTPPARAVFKDGDDMLDLARFYAARPALRADIAGRAKACIQARHTYEHRLTHMLDHMRRRHPSAVAMPQAARLPQSSCIPRVPQVP